MIATAQEIFDKLVNEDRIFDIQGQIRFYLGDVDIIVKQKDVVGNIIQEWLEGWLESKDIEFSTDTNPQMPPDFFLNPADTTHNLLEVKAFNYNASPAFDIADFRMYAEEILAKPYMLDVDYLIFAYEMTDDGYVVIRNLWLKKVWQITRRMDVYPLNLQIKDGVIHKIRPAVWYSTRPVDYKPFESLEDFISAFEETVFKEPRFRNTIAGTWLERFQRKYREFYGTELEIPRWNDIKENYNTKRFRLLEKAEKEVERLEGVIRRWEQQYNSSNERYLNATTERQKQSALEQRTRAERQLNSVRDKLEIAQQTVNSLR